MVQGTGTTQTKGESNFGSIAMVIKGTDAKGQNRKRVLFAVDLVWPMEECTNLKSAPNGNGVRSSLKITKINSKTE